ncbi:MAG: acyltransferase [Fuerstiella sp.]
MKDLIKSAVRAASIVTMLPVLAMYAVTAACVGKNGAFVAFSQFLCQFPGKTGVYLRHAFYQFAAAKCDADAFIGYGTIFSDRHVSIGQSTYIGNYCSIGNVTIEEDVLIASHVSLMNGTRQHRIDRLDIPVREQVGEFPPITIGKDSWIGEKAIVSANIGKHCVVGAGAVVLSDLPDYAIAVGVPAKIVGDRREQTSHSDSR